jgi:hypothetical protein
MSYFMTTAGPWIDLSDLSPIELIAAEQAQYYIKDRQAFLSQEDGAPLFLVHDGETGTSDNIILDANSYLFDKGTLAGSTLLELCKRLCHKNHIFRIWYASNQADAHLQVTGCHSLEEVIRAIEMCENAYEDIQIRYAGRQS